MQLKDIMDSLDGGNEEIVKIPHSKKFTRGFTSTRKPCESDLPKWLSRFPHFITGSIGFGCPHLTSDLDVAIPIMEREALLKRYLLSEMEPSHYNLGVKAMENGICVNFIFLHPLDYCARFRAKNMAIAGHVMKATTKTQRYAHHEMLVAIAKLTLGENVNAKNFLEFCK